MVKQNGHDIVDKNKNFQNLLTCLSKLLSLFPRYKLFKHINQ